MERILKIVFICFLLFISFSIQSFGQCNYVLCNPQCVIYCRSQVPSLPYGLISYQDKLNKAANEDEKCVGCISIHSTSTKYGHVAYVDDIYDNGKIKLLETNIKAPFINSSGDCECAYGTRQKTEGHFGITHYYRPYELSILSDININKIEEGKSVSVSIKVKNTGKENFEGQVALILFKNDIFQGFIDVENLSLNIGQSSNNINFYKSIIQSKPEQGSNYEIRVTYGKKISTSNTYNLGVSFPKNKGVKNITILGSSSNSSTIASSYSFKSSTIGLIKIDKLNLKIAKPSFKRIDYFSKHYQNVAPKRINNFEFYWGSVEVTKYGKKTNQFFLGHQIIKDKSTLIGALYNPENDKAEWVYIEFNSSGAIVHLSKNLNNSVHSVSLN